MTATELPYGDVPGQTHWEGCWRARGHHNCAVREIERLRAAPREPEEGNGSEMCPECGYNVLVTDPDLREPVEARVHAPDCPRTRYVVEYGVEAPPNVRHVRPHRSGCGHYDCAAPRPDAGDGTGEP